MASRAAGGTAATARPGMAGLIEDSIRRAPDRIALGVAGGGMRLSYRELGRLVRALASRLTEAGINRADPIGIYCDNRPEFVLALLAAWTTGAVAVPIDPELTGVEVHTRLAAVDAKAVLLAHHLRESYPADADARPAWVIDIDAARAEVAVTDVRHGHGVDRTAPSPARATPGGGPGDADAPAVLLFTTGSTGTPKIVPLTHANLAASVAGILSAYHLGPDDATLVIMPLFHGHGLIAGLLATLASRGAAHLPAGGRFSAHLFWDETADAKATWYTAVPTVHQILLARADTDYPADAPPPLRFIRSCSAPLAPAVLHRTRERFGAPVIPAYGMTETAHQATSNPLPPDGACKDASVGHPTGLELRVTTAHGTPAAVGETGEVHVRGPALTGGYLNDPQATAAAFTDGWFRTGDLGHLDSDGYLFLSGRTKDLINRGGEKIAPHTVEAVLLAHPAVQDALAFAVPDAKYGEEINAAVILRPRGHTTQADLQQHCRARLSDFEIPKRIHFLDRFPRTAKGDSDRRALAAELTRDQPAS
ncbi:Acyl-CoA synthetase (AMP-forming)/AMP-acid ligase II [Thermomonospora echinospora]|uniref:Acyl-CoA synthetase (AMP-forming)/AMP-acid ligase II n=1 Tax=Thermomonospora echinospora TaxID=1992 RepID=A0A1H6E511_9ACTN|nr:AMP-binding protein [Thermomonospora echinospora]SEG92780.1 Acyl-CoA synthetase (AMP-forming)/AMP-acid ligase II [Thermomonospora echinospora]